MNALLRMMLESTKTSSLESIKNLNLFVPHSPFDTRTTCNTSNTNNASR
jgi:hypothetical protein